MKEENTCIECGCIIPEGRTVCYECTIKFERSIK